MSGLFSTYAYAQSTQAEASPATDDAAQSVPESAAADEQMDAAPEIVVTGTLLRGVAPTGTNVIGVDRASIEKSGVVSSNDLLADIPQVANLFNTIPKGGSDAGLPLVRPNIRGLGGSGSNTTLVLLNGHRLVSVGVTVTTPDVSVIPPGVIERVEIVPDGGSATYGSDAIGGVINFITRTRFDGVEADARYGFADGYDTIDANLTVGKDWGSGSIFASYAYDWHNNILGSERDYVTQLSKDGLDSRSTSCTPGNVTANGINYPLPGLTAGPLNRCDLGETTDYYPRETRHSVFVGFVQDLSDRATLNISGYWSRRQTDNVVNQTTGSGVITSANPYFRPIAGETQQTVAFGFEPAFGAYRHVNPQLDSWGITPTLTYKLGSRWQVRAEGNYGRSATVVYDHQLNQLAINDALAGTTTATALNPYDVTASAPAVLANLGDFINYAHANQELADGRVILDGPLFALPGGDVQLAVGGEFRHDVLDGSTYIGPVVGNGQRTSSHSRTTRNITSFFGELHVPIIGPENSMPGLRALELSGSLRYDDYNDVGGTTNPKIGATYKPFDSVTIRGNWGTSFNAPSMADSTNTVDLRAQIFANSSWLAPDGTAADRGRTTVLYAGGFSELQPEKADTWSAGADWKPEFAPGLTLSATYFNVHYSNQIGLAPFSSPNLFSDPSYADFYILNPTQAQLESIFNGVRLDGTTSIASLYENGKSPYLYVDARRHNFATVDIDGIDFNLNYVQRTGFGSVNFNFGGTNMLNRHTKANANAVEVDNLANGTRRLSFIGAIGATAGPVSGQVRYNYGGGYPILGVADQDRIESFQTVALNLAYSLDGPGALSGLQFSLNVDNLFDTDPPYINRSPGYANGSTFGRLVTLGVKKKF